MSRVISFRLNDEEFNRIGKLNNNEIKKKILDVDNVYSNNIEKKIDEILLNQKQLLDELKTVYSKKENVYKEPVQNLGTMNDNMRVIIQKQDSDTETCPCGVVEKRRKMHKSNKIKGKPQKYYCDNCYNELATRM